MIKRSAHILQTIAYEKQFLKLSFFFFSLSIKSVHNQIHKSPDWDYNIFQNSNFRWPSISHSLSLFFFYISLRIFSTFLSFSIHFVLLSTPPFTLDIVFVFFRPFSPCFVLYVPFDI